MSLSRADRRVSKFLAWSVIALVTIPCVAVLAALLVIDHDPAARNVLNVRTVLMPAIAIPLVCVVIAIVRERHIRSRGDPEGQRSGATKEG